MGASAGLGALMNDATLQALREGDATAIDAFCREHAATVLGWTIRLGGPALDAEDLAQDVFAVALRRLSTFRGDSKPTTWLYGIARRVIANARRKAALRRFIGLEDHELRDDSPGADDVLEHRRRRRAVQHALERLATKPREAVVLVDLEGRSGAEVATMLGVPIGTVYSRLHHGRRALADALRTEGIVSQPPHLVVVKR